LCDALDNNCNGTLNEGYANYGKPCASDDGKPAPGDGACRTTGTFVCDPVNNKNQPVCSAKKASCAGLPGGCTELCDGIDNDCDGLVDEAFNNKGSDPNFVKPAVVNATSMGTNLWIFAYEASRPNATGVVPGTGNGYTTTAPAGVTLDKTPACSAPGKIPWFNVTASEVEQACTARGGSVCLTAQWQTACHTNAASACKWGYAPQDMHCTSPGDYPGIPMGNVGTKYCNLGPFDFDPVAAGDQDGLLVTKSPLLKNCYADWTNSANIYDMTGNLREITKTAAGNTLYPIMGGSFNTQADDGGSCDFSFYTIETDPAKKGNPNFQLFDVGFRCCFTSDPTM
jgi:hypothetical protein